MKKYVFLVLALVCMGIIFYNSSRTGLESNKLSIGIVDYAKNEYRNISGAGSKEVKPDNKTTSIYKNKVSFNIFLRKNAHAFEFLILAVILMLMFFDFGYSLRKSAACVLLICTLYAASDEIHQIFVPGRTAAVFDVFIDCIGSMIGVLVWSGFQTKFLEKK